MGPNESPAAAEPRWVMLSNYGCPGVADAKTMADSCTSAGRHIRVSLAIAPPPALSFIYYDTVCAAVPASIDQNETRHVQPEVIAAHGDSVLLKVACDDYFLYRTSAGSATQPPSLSLLPTVGGRCLTLHNTGLLRRGTAMDELLVVQLELPPYTLNEPLRDTVNLYVLRPGNDDWEINRVVPIVDRDGGGMPAESWCYWDSVAAVPVGDRYMCWVNYLSGFLLCDMEEEASTPMLRYVQLPAALTGDDEEEDDDVGDGYSSDGYNNRKRTTMRCSRNMCAAGASSVRLVSVDPRCCCGGRGTSFCRRSRYAFTVTTWTMTLRTDDGPMVWVKEGVLDSDELWALPEYGGLPRVPLQYPFVSSDNPDIVCFMVRSDYRRYDCYEGKTWMVEVDTRSKTLRSVLPYIVRRLLPSDAESIVTAKLHY